MTPATAVRIGVQEFAFGAENESRAQPTALVSLIAADIGRNLPQFDRQLGEVWLDATSDHIPAELRPVTTVTRMRAGKGRAEESRCACIARNKLRRRSFSQQHFRRISSEFIGIHRHRLRNYSPMGR